MISRTAKRIESPRTSSQQGLARASLTLAVLFVPLYAFLWILYPRLYFSQYIQTKWSFLGYTLYMILIAQVAIFAVVKFQQQRYILFVVSVFATTLVLRVMLYDPSSYLHFEYFAYAFGLATYIFAIDMYGRQIFEFIDNKGAAMLVLLLIPVLPLSIIGISAASATIEKVVIFLFMGLTVIRNTGWKLREC